MKTKFLTLLLFATQISFAAYEDHFPTYYEYCTGTRWKLKSGEVGGSPGHSFNYIHGLCKDYTSDYPQVIPCSEVSKELKEQYPHNGVGISLDKNFSNVTWVAIPGRDLTIFGESERSPITLENIETAIKRVTDLKVFHDVRMKPEKFQNLEFNSPEYLETTARETIGTDYAVNWARTLHCVRIPFPSSRLKKLSDYLNQANLQYRTGPGYQWDKVKNNCTHLAINMGNTLGINKAISTDQDGIKQLFNLALPANTFMMYADLAVLNKLKKRKLRKLVEEKGFSPLQLGSLLMKYEAYADGEYFDTKDLTVLTLPRVKKPHRLLDNPKKYERFINEETTELKNNAEAWLTKYQQLFEKLASNEKDLTFGSYLKSQILLAEKILAEI